MGSIQMKEKPDNSVNITEETDIFAKYIENRKKVLANNSFSDYQSALSKFQDFLDEKEYAVEDIGQSEAVELINWLISRDELAENTANRYARRISNMVDWYNTKGYFEWNPVQIAIEDTSFNIDQSTNRPEIPLPALREAILSIDNDTLFVAVVIMLKTGVRKAEAINLDERDVHIDHPVSKYKQDPRPKLRDHPDTILIPSDIRSHQPYNGEFRKHGNKRKRDTYIPIDNELKRVLIWWFGMAPKSQSPGRAVIRGSYRSTVGLRWSSSNLGTKFSNWAKEHGFKIEGAVPSDNVTPHWTRHFFTTHLRNRVTSDDLNNNIQPRHYVKSLRGDAGEDVIDTYLHEWGDDEWKRTAYLKNIPNIITNPS